jgi:guanylate kinase
MTISTSTFPLIIIVGPAAVGKTTIIKAIRNLFPDLRTSVTYTTRAPRQKTGSEDKIMFHVSPEEFMSRKEKGEFIESAIVHGDWYGTHAEETEALLATNPVIFNVDVQGLEQLKTLYGKRAVSIFIAPESVDVIIRRLRARGESSEENFQARLQSAEKELAKQDGCDYKIVNIEGKIQDTIDQVAEIIDNCLALDKNLAS